MFPSLRRPRLLFNDLLHMTFGLGMSRPEFLTCLRLSLETSSIIVIVGVLFILAALKREERELK